MKTFHGFAHYLCNPNLTFLGSPAIRLALQILCFFAIATIARAQTDLVLNAGSSYVDVGRSLTWGTSQVNRAFVLTPNSPNAGVCIYVVNNNPTNSHTFTMSVLQTPDARAVDYSNNTSRYTAANVVGNISPAAAVTMTSAYVQTTAAAKIAFVFAASAGAAGTPDTADIFMVQTLSSSCGLAATGLTKVQGPAASGLTPVGNPLQLGTITSANVMAPLAAEDGTGATCAGCQPLLIGFKYSGISTSNITALNQAPLLVTPTLASVNSLSVAVRPIKFDTQIAGTDHP